MPDWAHAGAAKPAPATMATANEILESFKSCSLGSIGRFPAFRAWDAFGGRRVAGLVLDESEHLSSACHARK
jgi:hypothetical protein